MSDGSENKSRIWIYAVILFSSAFIVLLLTAYSQIKLNKSISEYKSQLNSIEIENDNAKLNLNSAIELNEELSKKIDELNKEIENSDKKIREYEDLLNNAEESSKNIVTSYEALIGAQLEYEKGNFTTSAMLLHDKCNPAELEENALKIYSQLQKKVYKKASHQFYADGYSLYKSKKYDEAIKKFKSSLVLSESEYYSDDCYYFIAYSYYYSNDHEKAREAVETLLEKYPGSTYTKPAKDLLKMLD